MIIFILLLSLFRNTNYTVDNNNLKDLTVVDSTYSVIRPGAYATSQYLPLLRGKKVGVLVNQTSEIYNKHLVDTLRGSGINIVKIFVPEHGFRGDEDAGTEIGDQKDKKTGISIVSLYGQKTKPTKEDLDGLDVIVFDIQDVGARFYTYISTLHYLMEACAENNKQLIVLDRPNPNGHYVDGPVLKNNVSFVGVDPLPIVYGMTIGELAKMINGEKWLKNGLQCKLAVIPCSNYDHTTKYNIPVAPSPNLSSMRAIYLYPSLCLFEGTLVSVGRGTNKPFQIYGMPESSLGSYSFTPKPSMGAKDPLYNGKECIGVNLQSTQLELLANQKELNLSYLLNAYISYNKPDFFLANLFFDKLAGSDALRTQILAGVSENEIRACWVNDLKDFKMKRKKYLLYKDFE